MASVCPGPQLHLASRRYLGVAIFITKPLPIFTIAIIVVTTVIVTIDGWSYQLPFKHNAMRTSTATTADNSPSFVGLRNRHSRYSPSAYESCPCSPQRVNHHHRYINALVSSDSALLDYVATT